MCLRDAFTAHLLTESCFCLRRKQEQLSSGTESSEEEVETAWVGLGISQEPLVPLSHFSSSPPWVEGLDLSGVNQLRPRLLPE